MKTKEKILKAAIKLFNAKGINDVSIRDIASELGMSSGNFAYHFKNKEALLQYFYESMYNEVTIKTELDVGEGFEALQKMLTEITAFMTTYRFFYTDIIHIFRSCPQIKKDYANNYEQRKSIYQNIFHHFVSEGLMIAPEDDASFDQTAHNIWFTLTFWQSQKKVLPTGAPQVQQEYILHQIWNSLVPYMTQKGLEQHRKLSL